MCRRQSPGIKVSIVEVRESSIWGRQGGREGAGAGTGVIVEAGAGVGVLEEEQKNEQE